MEVLIKERRLRPVPKVLSRTPTTDADWYIEAIESTAVTP